eukprot:gene8304-biopygen15154
MGSEGVTGCGCAGSHANPGPCDLFFVPATQEWSTGCDERGQAGLASPQRGACLERA